MKNTRHIIQDINVEVTGRYFKRIIKQMAIFECKLVDFCSSRIVQVKAYIDEDAVGSHDVVSGKRFCAKLGIVLNYKTKTTIWDDLSIPMTRTRPATNINFISDDPWGCRFASLYATSNSKIDKGYYSK